MIRRHFNHHILFGRILRYFRIFRVSAQFWAQIWTRNHQKWVHTTQLSLGNTPGAGFEISWFLGGNIISTIQSSSVKYLLHLQVHSELLCCDTFFCVCRRTFFNILYASKLAGGLRIQSKARIRGVERGTDEIEQQRVALRNRVALGNSSFLWLKSGREREREWWGRLHSLSVNKRNT